MMGEILSLLQAQASTKPPLARVADSGVQTSPCPCLNSEKTRYFQGLQLSTGPAPQPRGETGYLGPLQPIDKEPSRTSDPNPQAAAQAEPERAEALTHRTCEMPGQKAYHTRAATACTAGVPEGAAGTWTPEIAASCSQPGAEPEKLAVLTEADGGVPRGRVPKQAGRQKRAFQRRPRTRVPKRSRKAPLLRGGRGNSNRGRATMPANSSCQGPANHTPENAGVCFDPCDGWSQDSNSTHFVSGCETTAASWVMPLSEANTGITQKGFWQLFDFCDNSD